MALTSLHEAGKKIAKAYGKEAGGKGFKFPKFARLPTGILPLDIALAGGIPLGAVSLFYGNESCGKTSLALRIAAQYQKRFPKKKVCWIDVEKSWDEDWVKLHGVDPEQVWLYMPTTAEEAADIVKELALAKEAGLLIVDSIAALASIDQLEKSAEQVVVAGAAKPSTRLIDNVGMGMVEHAKEGEYLTCIYINQPRMKIGFHMGNPEFVPGPVKQNYQAFLKLRLSAKDVLKEKLAPIPIYKDSSMRIVKKKFPCIRQAASWQMALYPYNGGTEKNPVKVKPLEVNNRKQIENIYDAQEWLKKDGKDWVLWPNGECFDTKDAALTHALENYDETLEFICSELLLLYKDEIENFVVHGKEMSG